MFTTTITPRVSETDGAGHINNVFVPVWFEAGRREIFQILTPDLGFESWHAVLVNMNVDYEAQIFFQKDVEIRTWIERIGTRSFQVYEEIWQGEQRCCKGTATYVYFNFKTQKSETIPESVVQQFQQHLINQ